MKKPIVVAIINMLFIGLGYILLGKRVVFGAMLFPSTLLAYLWMYLVPHAVTPWFWGPTQFTSVIGVAAFLLLNAAFAYDAYTLAKK